MRKMFTKLFSLALLMLLFSTVTVKAQDACGSTISASDVVLVTDLTTVCDSDYVLYHVVGYAGAEFAFNLDNDPGGFGGFTNDSAIVVKEGVGFRVQIRENDTCYSNELHYVAEDLIVPVEIQEPSVEHPACYGDNGGEITINYSGKHDPLTFYMVPEADWSGAADYPANIVPGSKIAVEPGTYYVAVQEPNDCSVSLDSISSWDTAIVNGPPTELVVDTIYGTDPLCVGADGSVTVVVSGSIGGEYEVTVDGETMTTTNDTAVFDLPAGVDYYAMVVDSNGCEATSDSMVTLVDPEAITFDIALVDVTCADSAIGQIKVFDFTPAGGTFTASLGDGNWVAQTGDTIFITGLEAGYYSLFVDNTADFCDSVAYDNGNETGNVISLQAPGEIDYTVVYEDTIMCAGDSTMITVSGVTGGSGSYEYYLDSDNGLVSDWSSTASWKVGSDDDFEVIVRDVDDMTCEVAWPLFDIEEIWDVNIDDIETVSPTCPGGNDGLIKIFAEYGNGTYEYSIDGETWYVNNVFAVAGGYYDVYLRDPMCPESYDVDYSVYVDDYDGNYIYLDYADTIVCEGALSDGFGGYGYWESTDDNDGDVQVYYSTSLDDIYVSGTELDTWWDGGDEIQWETDGSWEPGTYYIWAKDNYGCVFDEDIDGTPDYLTVTISENPIPTVTATITEEATCFEDNDGILTLHLNGEPLDDLYYILANSYEAAMNKDAIDDGIMWPTGADSVNIQVGKGTYYAVLMDDYCDDEEKSISGPFTVEGYDAVMIDEDPVSVTDIVCYGEANGEIVIADATGGSGDLVYTLYINDGGWEEVTGYVGVTGTTFTGLVAGDYYVEVTDLGGCDGDETDVIEVEGPDAPVYLYDWYVGDITCNGASDGVTGFWVEGGTGPYEYKIGTTNWQDFPAEAWAKPGHTQELVITEPGDYTVWMRDSKGCMAEPYEFTIEEPTAIMMDLTVSDISNTCDDPNGMISGIVDGGNTDTFMVEVIGAETITIYTDSLFATLDTLAAGTYTVKVTEIDGNGCYAMEEVVITAPNALSGVAVVADSVHCNGSDEGVIVVSGVTGGVAPYELVLSGAMSASMDYDADETNAFDELVAGTYSVTIIDSEGCEFAINSIVVSEPDELMLEATWMSNITCDAPGQFSIQAAGGVGNYKYFAAISILPEHILIPDSDDAAWQDDSVFSVTEAGTYIVWAMDSNMCVIGGEEDDMGDPVNEWRVQILEPATVVSFDKDSENDPLCNGDMTASVIVSNIVVTEDGVPMVDPAVTVVIDGIENDTVTDLGAGTYYITVTDDATGCSTMDSVVITEPEVLQVMLDKVDGEFSCPDVTEGFIQASAMGGYIPVGPVVEKSATDYSPFYEFQLWQDGVLKTDYISFDAFLVEVGHEYVVVVRDMNGCTDTSNVIAIDTVASIDFAIIGETTCSSDTAASVEIEVSGEAGRMFQVQWTQIEDGDGSVVYSDTSDWYPAGVIELDQVFLFDNESLADKHYDVSVIDNMGCSSDSVYSVTYDKIANEAVALTVTIGVVGDCTTDVTISAAGGVGTYTYMVDDVVVEGGLQTLVGGEHTIYVEDMNGCWAESVITLDYGTTIDTTFNIYEGDSANLVYETLDTLLVGGSYTFYYDEDPACIAKINATVVERPKTAPVVDTMTPQDTIEFNHPDFVITFVDAVTFNADGNLYVTAKDSTEATLVLPITAANISADGKEVTVSYVYPTDGALELNATYVVTVDSAVFMGDGLVWDGIDDDSWMFTTGEENLTAVDDISNGLEFKVYPNPFNDIIKIDNYDKLTRVVLTNIAGQRVLDIEYPSYEIRTGNLVTGVYVVTLISNDNIVKSERIIKR